MVTDFLGRTFQLWSYRCSMSKLVLVSVKDDIHSERISLHFQGLKALNIRNTLTNIQISIKQTSNEDILEYVVKSDEGGGGITAAVGWVEIDDGEYFDAFKHDASHFKAMV